MAAVRSSGRWGLLEGILRHGALGRIEVSSDASEPIPRRWRG